MALRILFIGTAFDILRFISGENKMLIGQKQIYACPGKTLTREVHSANINNRRFQVSVWSDGAVNVKLEGGDWVDLEKCDVLVQKDVRSLLSHIG